MKAVQEQMPGWTAQGRRFVVHFTGRLAELVRPFGSDAKSDDCLTCVREARVAGDWQGTFEAACDLTNALGFLLNREIPYGQWTNLREY
ncbi:hypothetical protein [Deinococcus hopiensis]|nr:hypothetical protein [Deinococcus hopiensis]